MKYFSVKKLNWIALVTFAFSLQSLAEWKIDDEFDTSILLKTGGATISASPSQIVFGEGGSAELERAVTRQSMSLPEGNSDGDLIGNLVRQLNNDHELIYNYIHDRIKTDPYMGLLRSPERTLLDGAGSPIEQVHLYSECLRRIGASTCFADVQSWTMPCQSSSEFDICDLTGISDYKKAYSVLRVGRLALNLVDPATLTPSSRITIYWPMVGTKFEGEGYRYYFPWYKENSPFGDIDYKSDMGYSATALKSAAGGSTGTHWATGLDATSVSNLLTQYSTTLLSSFEQGHKSISAVWPNSEIITMRGIPHFPYPSATSIVNAWDLQPAYNGKLKFTGGSLPATTLKLYEVAHRKISIRFLDGSYKATICLDDDIVATESTGGSSGAQFLMTVEYSQYDSSDINSDVYGLVRGGAYTFCQAYGSGIDSGMTEYIGKNIPALKAAGHTDGSIEILTESLRYTGQRWMDQMATASRTSYLFDKEYQSLMYQFGIMGAESEGFYIDVKHQKKNASTGDHTTHFIFTDMFQGSAFEHAVLEQNQPGNAKGVSTIRILAQANADNMRIYRTDSSNWSSVKGNLSGYDKTAIGNAINQGSTFILPKNDSVSIDQWSGEGYVEYADRDFLGMIIGGGYDGGYEAGGNVFSTIIQQNTSRPDQTTAIQNFGVPASIDPVDMQTGAFLFNHNDLSMGGPLPLTLSRSYRSDSIDDGIMGYGWGHSFNLYAVEHSSVEQSLGDRSAEDMVPYLVGMSVMQDLLDNESSAKDWVLAALVSDWMASQLTQNAVSVYLGSKVLTFVKQPNGTFTPPPGMAVSLSKTNGVYVMQERNKNTYTFNNDLKLNQITDPDGNTLTFSYNAQTNLNTVISSFGPQFTFGYTGDLLTSVSDNSTPSRSIEYQYDSNNNLTNYIDAAGNSWGLQYGDPDHIHAITAITDPEGNTNIQNTYNDFGQVISQISAAGHTYTQYITDYESTEEDPLGNRTTYAYDDRGRTLYSVAADGGTNYLYYDDWNQVTNTVDAAGHSTVFVYDANHNLLAQINAVGTTEEVATHYGYDEYNRLRFVTNAVGTARQTVSETTYTPTHHPDHIIEAKGTADQVVTDLDYYPNGLLWKSIEGNGLRTMQTTYDSHGLPSVIASTDLGTANVNYSITGDINEQVVDGVTAQFAYDAERRLTNSTYAVGTPRQISTTQTYWKNGLKKDSIDANGATMTTYWTPAYQQAGIIFSDGSSVTNTYDSADRLIASRNPEGYWTTNTLDAVGRVLSVSSVLSSVSNQYDIVGNRTADTDAEGRTTEYTYDALSRKIRVDYANGTASIFGYDALNRLIVTTNQPGTSLERVTWNEFDAIGRLLATTNALGNTSSFEYNALGYQVGQTDALGNETRTAYNAQGKPTAITNALGQVTHMAYDLNGNLETVTDALGRTTQYTYDELNRRTRTDYPDGTFSMTTYDKAGNVIAKMDARGNSTTFGYNSMNRLVASTSTVDSVSAVIHYTYNNNGKMLTSTDAEGHITSYEYDALGRNVSIASTYSEVTNQLDRVGNVTQTITDPAGLNLWASSSYDDMNQLTNRQSAISNRKFLYDALGRQTKTTDPLSKQWHTEYNLLDQPVAATRPTGAREETNFDALGRRTRFVNAEGKAVRFGLDALGRITAITNAIGKVTTFDFDAAGNMASRLSADNELTEYGYDSMNQLVAITNESVLVATFDHDSNGNRIAQASPISSSTFGYNEHNLLTASTQTVHGVTAVVQNTFDLNGNRTSIAYPGGLTVDYTYDEDNRLVDITADGPMLSSAKTTQFGYDTASRLTSIDYPNGVNSTFDYDAESRVIGFSHGSFIERSIARDARGYKTSDDFLNGLEPTVIEGEQKITNNSADQITHIDQRDSWLGGELNQWYNRDFTYNNNGCLSLQDVSRPTWNTNSAIEQYELDYTYDYDNRLTGVNRNTSNKKDVQYLYDASGARIGRINGYSDTGTWTTNYFIVDYTDGLKRPLAETDASGTITCYYVWSGPHLLCHIEADGTTRYYHADELGSTLALTDETGSVTDEFGYLPYGKCSSRTGSTQTPFQWLGGYGVYYDADTDLHLTLHRAYSTTLKKFIQADPLGIDGGVNVYAWANLNPLFFVDPYGLSGLESLFNGSFNLDPNPCIVCHGYNGSGKVPGYSLTQSMIPGVGNFDSGSTGNILGNFGAGAAGAAVSLPQRLLNTALYVGDLFSGDYGEGAGFPSFTDYTNAEGTRNSVQQFVYNNVDPNSLITQSGAVAGDLLASYGLAKATSFAGSQASSWINSTYDDMFSGWYANQLDDTVYGVLDDLALEQQQLMYVSENLGTANSASMQAAHNFEAGTTGALSSLSTQQRIVPALKFNNPNPNGAGYVKFDGIRALDDGMFELIDAKTRIVPFSTSSGPFISNSVRDGLIRKSLAIQQNPSYTAVLEFSTTAARQEAQLVLRQLGINNISTRVR